MQRMLILALSCAGLTWISASAPAQTTDAFSNSESEMLAQLPSEGTVTPEMWFYQQEYRRHQSPREAVRRKAEFRTAQRQRRLACQKWFGISNLRPTVSPIPYYASNPAFWSGTAWNHRAWVGSGVPHVVYRTARRTD